MLTIPRLAAWLRPRLVFAGLAGAIVWAAWLVGCAFGATAGDIHNIRYGFGETDAAGTVIGMDHMAFYAPAKRIREGRGGEIYNLGLTAEHQQSLILGGGFDGKLEAFRNPPFFALLFLPTAGLPYLASVWIWTGLGFLAYALSAALIAPGWRLRAGLWGLTFLPAFAAIGYGQSSFLSLLVFAVVYRLLSAGNLTAAGLVAALLWFKPPLLIGLVAWWLLDWRRYWPAIIGLGCGGALLFVLTLPVIPDAWHGFFVSLGGNAQFDSFDWWKAHSARAFWRLLLTPDAAPLPNLLWLISVILAGAWFVGIWRRNRDSVPTLFAAAIALTLFASPHVMIYDWAVLLAAAWIVWEHRPDQRDLWIVIFALCWLAFFISTDFGHLQHNLLVKLIGRDPPPGVVQVSQPAFALTLWLTRRVGAVAKP